MLPMETVAVIILITPVCKVSTYWSDWSSWTSCTKTCNSGLQYRFKSCIYTSCQPYYSYQSSYCNTHSCPVNGNWGSWQNWKSCSVSCNTGTRTRRRSCDNPSPSYGGSYCTDSSSDTEFCNTNHCPINGNWGSWQNWGSCSVSCNTGTRIRSRGCNNPPPSSGGSSCTGSSSNTEYCNTHQCPINGMWGQWTTLISCSVSCGGGTQVKTRNCDSPTPAYGGIYCSGSSLVTHSCNPNPCPIDGNWDIWSNWTSCNVSCGEGYQNRSRECNNPFPVHGGQNCRDEATDIRPCYQGLCAEDVKKLIGDKCCSKSLVAGVATGCAVFPLLLLLIIYIKRSYTSHPCKCTRTKNYSDEQDDQNTMRIQKTLAFDNAEYSGGTADNQQNKISVIYENLRVF